MLNINENLEDHLSIHKEAIISSSDESEYITISANTLEQTTPGCFTTSDFEILKYVNYTLTISAELSYDASDSEPFIIVAKSSNLNKTYNQRVYITDFGQTDYIINFSSNKNANVKIGILLGGNRSFNEVNIYSIYFRKNDDDSYLKLYENDTTTGIKTLNENINLSFGSDLKPVIYGHSSFDSGLGACNNVFGNKNLNNNLNGTNNCVFGYHNLDENFSGDYNTCIGNNNLNENLSGNENMCIGTNNLVLNDGGGKNITIGNNNLNSNVNGDNNFAIGHDNLNGNTEGLNNICIGTDNMKFSTTADNNICLGKNNLSSDVNTGNNNICIGDDNLIMNTTGEYNYVFGYNNLINNTTGNYNLTCGRDNLKMNTTGDNNIIYGINNLSYAENTSNNNIIMGQNNLNYNTTGYSNICIGEENLNGTDNTEGIFNICLGTNNLHNNILNSGYNVALGRYNLYNNPGTFNVSLGYACFYEYSNMNYSIGIGYESGRHNDGDNNIFIGKNAGGISLGIYEKNYSNSICIGTNSGVNYAGINGDNIFIGRDTGYNTIDLDYANVVCIGATATATGSNQIRLGTSSQSVYAGPYITISDIRDKTDIETTTLGLEFINNLRPVDYVYDYRESYKKSYPEILKDDATEEEKEEYEKALEEINEYNKYSNLKHDGTHKRIRKHHGFIAQEVGALNVFGGYNDGLVNNGEDIKTLNYSEFIAPLVKAVQELHLELKMVKEILNEKSLIIDDLKKELQELKK